MLRRVRSTCSALPAVVEEAAWTGVRWCIRKKNFAHVVQIEAGWPPAYAKAAGTDGPMTVLTVRVDNEDYEALSAAGRPAFRPPWGINWRPPVIGLALDDATDWAQISELIVASYCLLAPKKLAAAVQS